MAVHGSATVRSLSNPLAHTGGGTASLSVALAAKLIVVWADGQPDDTYGTTAANRVVRSLYAGTPATVDGSAFVWLVVASQGSATLWLAKEVDLASLGGLVPGGEYAVLYRIDGGQLQKVPQV